MTDVSTLKMSAPTGGGNPNPSDISALVSSATDPVTNAPYSIDVGHPVVTDAGGNTILLAKANALGTAVVPGLAATAGEAPGSVRLRTAGPLTLTAAQWDAVTGQSGGLTPRAIYYLSAANAGKLTTVAPANPNYVTVIGFALNPTTMMIQIVPPVLG